MAHDLYNEFSTAREVWEEAEYHLSSFFEGKPVKGAPDHSMRDAFERQLLQGQTLDRLVHPGANRKPGWFTNLVFGGSQLELTRPENAMPAILTVTLSFMRVLRREFGVDLIKDHIHWAAGHGSGVYASLIATGSLLFCDALRAVRYRGLEAARCLEQHPVLFPKGCERPASIFETWGFANVSSGKGGQLELATEDAAKDESQKAHWRGTQVSAVVLRPGMLDRALQEVESLQQEIEQGAVPGIAPQEFVAVANINSQVQIVLAGTTVGVNYACDRLNFRGIGARAVNLPVSGPYHTSFVDEAAQAYGHVVDVLPIQPPSPSMRLISSVDGHEIKTVSDLRHDLRVALNAPIRWLKTIDTLVSQGVKRFVCLGPGRTIAQQLSRELGLREQARVKAAGPHALARKGTLDEEASEFEVWSIATTDGLNQLVSAQYEKVGFYFAVQEGGNFDIDYSVMSPSNRVILEGEKSSQEDFVFTGNEMGEYRFCFHNQHVSHAEKLAKLLREQSTPVEDSMSNIDSDFTSIERTLRYFRMRENQGYSLVELTRFIEGLFIISISLGQVYIVRLLFNRGSSSRFRV
ncbi:[acyl-carrier-protein] S-malonyltransferase [Malassezia caprae]|uniref:[acyl-carrier-protein] S-malonyltransferase n=1 Tax=Malassezia caprae TaxID=1381934 RepID=A0AAF0IU56_9BASI|nr:[acyl-carrier-protein] S-malonyltransferase [Malassezia caprae]